jgi:hypothetical protein
MPTCKHHFIAAVRNILRCEFRKTYRHSDNAFVAIDSNLTGYAKKDEFCQNLASKRATQNFNVKFSIRGFKLN